MAAGRGWTDLNPGAGEGLGAAARALGWGAGAATTVVRGAAAVPPAPPRGGRAETGGGGGAEPPGISRVTLEAGDAGQVHAFLAREALAGYDVVAVAPGGQEAFDAACASPQCDLVALDLAQKLPFRLRQKTVAGALRRKAHFEVCYAGALRGPAARAQLFANARALAWATGGKGLVLSSGARAPLELRAPDCAANLAAFLGLAGARARARLRAAPRAVLRRGAARRARHLRPP